MIFGRVEAVAQLANKAQAEAVRVTVYFETGRAIRTVRDEVLPLLRPIASDRDLAWHADQYAQETITNELAVEGWEVIGGGEIPPIESGALPRSAAYAVRRTVVLE